MFCSLFLELTPCYRVYLDCSVTFCICIIITISVAFSPLSCSIVSPARGKLPIHDGRPAWMRTLHVTATDWLTMIPGVSNCTVVGAKQHFHAASRLHLEYGRAEKDSREHQRPSVQVLRKRGQHRPSSPDGCAT